MIVNVALPVPLMFTALIAAAVVPDVVVVPLIRPEAGLMLRPAGRPVAL